MVARDVQAQVALGPEVTAALLDLARLTLRAEASASAEQEPTASLLLDRLLAYSQAQRGALVLTTQPAEAGPLDETQIPASEFLRALAIRGVGEDTIRRLVAAPPSLTDSVGAEGSAELSWFTHVLPAGDLMTGYTGESQAQQGRRRIQPVVILGWAASPHVDVAVEKARALLLVIGDAAGAVVANILRAQRIRELEAAVARADALLHEVGEVQSDWEQTFDAVSDPMCVLTPGYRIIRVNAAYTQMFGSSREDREGKGCYSGWSAVDSPCADCPLPTTLNTRQPSFMQQERLVPSGSNGDRRKRIFQTWTYPVFNANGEVDRLVEILKDVTEQERLRQAMSQAEALREADRLKAELLGTVSHELRSPLAAIKGYAATLLRHGRRLPREERREFLLAIDEASGHLGVIIDRLLEMSQLETGALKMDRSPVNMAFVASEAITAAERQSAKSEFNQHAFALELRDIDGLPTSSMPLVLADPRRLRDVLDNLLENAVKYSPDGGEIQVTIRPTMRVVVPVDKALSLTRREYTQQVRDDTISRQVDRPVLEITVHDHGVGIPDEHLGRIFDRFHRVDTRLTREVDGLGLGLAISKRIVELHGGAIWAESQPGWGSTFHVVLPMDDVSQ